MVETSGIVCPKMALGRAKVVTSHRGLDTSTFLPSYKVETSGIACQKWFQAGRKSWRLQGDVLMTALRDFNAGAFLPFSHRRNLRNRVPKNDPRQGEKMAL